MHSPQRLEININIDNNILPAVTACVCGFFLHLYLCRFGQAIKMRQPQSVDFPLVQPNQMHCEEYN